ncbi:hypothetical protein DDF62_21915 [Caulobacter radicis]|uniref:hypothetical protein n=1 Tax=Caulobacter radicis TaxID=2172650 RepID=UPI000D57E890|nr:hypothetical protein [Caulobacter radicis]PVM84765.1 hypothetical protein DDF62_21915 [Caulobacter radicis]
MALTGSSLALPLVLPRQARVETTTDFVRERRERGRPTQRNGFQARHENLIRARDDGYRVSRRTLAFREVSTDAAPSGVRVAMDAASACDLSYVADRNLTPKSVENWQGGVSSAITAQLAQAGKAAGLRDDVLVAPMTLWAQTSAADAVHVVLAGELRLAAPVGAVFEDGEAIETQEPAAFAFGGHAVAGRTVLSLERVDEARGVAVLNYRREADPASTQAAIDGLVWEINLAEALKPEERAALQFEDTMVCRYEVDLKTGLATKAECERTTRETDFPWYEVIAVTERWSIVQTLTPGDGS